MLKVGQRVRVKKHWLRAGHVGTIAGYKPKDSNHWLVKFDEAFAGGGIDGDSLWIDEHDLEPAPCE